MHVLSCRVGAERWNDLERRISGEIGADALSVVLSQHITAPVRATFVAATGDRGLHTRLTLVEDTAVLISRRTTWQDGEPLVDEDAVITILKGGPLWPVLANVLPETSAMRATDALGGAEVGDVQDLDMPAFEKLTRGAESKLLVEVEAWPSAAREPAVAWHRLWYTVDGHLLDVRVTGEGLRTAVRRRGSVAAELRWALTGAIEAASLTGAEGSLDE